MYEDVGVEGSRDREQGCGVAPWHYLVAVDEVHGQCTDAHCLLIGEVGLICMQSRNAACQWCAVWQGQLDSGVLCVTSELTESAVEVASDEVADGCKCADPVRGVSIGGVARTQHLVEAAGSEERLERGRQLVLTMRDVKVAQHKDQLHTENSGGASYSESRSHDCLKQWMAPPSN